MDAEILATTISGAAAAVAATVSFLPQAIKTLLTKRTGDISLGMYSLLIISLSSWFTYGILLADWVIIMANGLNLIFALIVFVMKIRHK